MSLVPIYDISLPENSFTKILTFSCLHKESKRINDHMSEAFFFFHRQCKRINLRLCGLLDLGMMWQDLQCSPICRFRKSAHIV